MSWFKRQDNGGQLIGQWKIDDSDLDALAALGDVTLEFDQGGRLNYFISGDDKVEVILMTYETSGRHIITDQPSHPDPQKTEFSLSGDVLILMFGGQRSRFVRVKNDSA